MPCHTLSLHASLPFMLQGERDLVTVCNLVLSEIAPLVNAHQGMFYIARAEVDEPLFNMIATYAGKESKHRSTSVRLRDGLVGQCAVERSEEQTAEHKTLMLIPYAVVSMKNKKQ